MAHRTIDACPFTIPVIVRNFLHATRSTLPEFEVVGRLSLRPIIVPHLSTESRYRDDHPSHPSPLERILRGAGGSLANLVSKFDWYLQWLDILNAVHCVDTLLLFRRFLGSRTTDFHVQEYQRLLHDDCYWKILFAFLRRAVKDRTLDGDGQRAGDPPSARILSDTAHILTGYQELSAPRCQPLLKALMRADFFGVLDDLLPSYAKHPPPMAPSKFGPPLFILSQLTFLSRSPQEVYTLSSESCT